MRRHFAVFKSLTLRHLAGTSRLAAMVAVLSLGAPVLAGETSHAAYESALQSFHQHKLKHALIHVKNALQADPHHLPSKVLMAEILLAGGDGVGAANHLELARKAGADEKQIAPLMIKALLVQRQYDQALAVAVPDGLGQAVQSDIHVLHGAAHAGNNDLTAAAGAYGKAVELVPNNAGALVGQAQMAVRLGQTDAALVYADRLLAAAPGDPRAFLIKAVVHQHAGNVEAGLVSANQAVMLGAGNVPARITRALLLMDKGDTNAALADLDYILERRSLDPLATFMKYTILADGGRLQESEALLANLDTALERFPDEFKQDFPIYYYLSGLTQFHQKNFATARAELAHYRALVGDDFKTLKLLGQVDLALNAASSARKTLEKAQRLNTNDAQVLSLLGDVYWQLGAAATSEHYYLRAIEKQPQSLQAVTGLADLYLQADRPDRAALVLRRADALSSDPEALLLMVRACQSGGYVEPGLGYAGQLVELTPRDSEAHALRGALLLASGDLQRAGESYRTAIDLDGNNHQAVVGLSRVLLRQGEQGPSLALLQGQLDGERDNTDLLIAVGDVHASLNDRAKALFWYKKARAKDATNPLPVQRVVGVHLSDGDLPEAISVAREYLLLKPDEPQILQVAAGLYRADEQLEQAVVTLERLVDVARDKTQPLLSLAEVQRQIGSTAAARDTLTQAIAVDEGLVPAYLQMIDMAVADADTAEALQLIDRLQGVSGDTALIKRLRGGVYRQDGQQDRALGYYRESLAEAPSSQATMGLFQIYKERRQFDLAIPLLADWVEANPQDMVAAINLAETHRELRQLDKSSALYSDLLDRFPHNSLLLNNAAFIQLEAGDLERAIQLAEKAHHGAPDNPSIIDTRGWIETQRGNYEDALGLLRQASALDYDNAEIKYHVAFTLDKLERHDEARRVIAQISPAQMTAMIEQDILHSGLSQQLVDAMQR